MQTVKFTIKKNMGNLIKIHTHCSTLKTIFKREIKCYLIISEGVWALPCVFPGQTQSQVSTKVNLLWNMRQLTEHHCCLLNRLHTRCFKILQLTIDQNTGCWTSVNIICLTSIFTKLSSNSVLEENWKNRWVCCCFLRLALHFCFQR